MRITEIVEEAKAAGYTNVNDGSDTWDLESFAEAMVDDEGDYSLDYNGAVVRYKEDGYLESVAAFTFGRDSGN